ncbi:hypothetical protein RGQ21_28520 [Kitasatospora aureofaciens]|nr:hypothetical protein RGQ21_28520 [Kitasatospora aureofaciens]
MHTADGLRTAYVWAQRTRGNNDGGATPPPENPGSRSAATDRRRTTSRKFATPGRCRINRDGTERTRGAYTCHRGRRDPYGACGTSHGFLLMNPLVHRKEEHATHSGHRPVMRSPRTLTLASLRPVSA